MGYKPKEIVVSTSEEFQDMIDEKDFVIAESIVEGILANLEGTKRHVHLLSVVCVDEGAAYDITVERQHFATTLEENLTHYVREEKYEECQIIAEAIAKLKGGQISDILNQLNK